MSTPANDLPVVVIGAGPVGLAAAAHLVERGLDFTILEAGATVGASVAAWGHVRVFSPWRYNIDHAARRLLAMTEWTEPDPDGLPTGRELIDAYLRPLAAHPAIATRLRLGARVEAITRRHHDRIRTAGRDSAPFVVRYRDADDGTMSEILARAVIDASGTWTVPNVLGGDGLPAIGEVENAGQITAALPDVLGAHRDRFADRHTLVVGAGHSAATTLLELGALAETAPATKVTWAIRSGSASRAYGGGDADALPARGAIGTALQALVQAGRLNLVTGFHTRRIETLPGGGVELVGEAPDGTEQKVTADQVVNATGFRPDHTISSELRLDLDPILGSTRALAPLIDPNHHSCGTVPPHGVDELAHPEVGYYAIGVKSYGRAPTFLMATGYEQARSVVAALAGDWTSARQVQLELPETGVCTSRLPDGTADSACCGPPAAQEAATGGGRGLGTGLSGGLVALPVIDQTQAGCCG